jgi:hypothetical protein
LSESRLPAEAIAKVEIMKITQKKEKMMSRMRAKSVKSKNLCKTVAQTNYDWSGVKVDCSVASAVRIAIAR